jgi:drug/metabolite transporter (DMT)-like permease
MIEALRFAQASTVSPFRYVSLIWAGLLGFLVFGETPDNWTIAGGALIVLAGLYLIHRETRRPIRTPPPDHVA